ncbi:MAG: hypothetical protein J6T10_03175, partial [Methanobrevibacter sp.]|nr:hypothetical protein [Methanobrevibacter sp.]
YFKVIDNSKITTDKETYDYYEGINNKITLNITDESKEKGTIDVNVKEDNDFIEIDEAQDDLKNQSNKYKYNFNYNFNFIIGIVNHDS